MAAALGRRLGDLPVTGITDRSWEVEPGYIFVARTGHRTDGRAYAGEAVDRGAVAVVAESALDLPIPVVVVDDAAVSLGTLSAAFHGDPSRHLHLVGVTGTNGKTTVTFLVAAALQAAGYRVGTIGTLGVYLDGECISDLQLTTPAAPDLQALLHQFVEMGATHVVMEVSSHALIQKRTAGCRFDTAVFTNLSQDHTDYHGDMDRYLEAKGTLFSGRSSEGGPSQAVLNQDSLAFEYLRSITEVPVRTFGLGGDVRPVKMEFHGLSGTHIDLEVGGESLSFHLRLPGAYNVENALAAIACSEALGVAPDVAAQAVGAVENVPGRLQSLDFGQPFRIVIDYAHNPAGLVQLLRLVRGETAGRLITVFGGRGERDRGKRPMMGAIAASLGDHMVVTVDNPRGEDPGLTAEEVAAGVRACGGSLSTELDRYEAIRLAMKMARAGDTITISGKGTEVWDERHRGRPMTDEQAVRQIWEES